MRRLFLSPALILGISTLALILGSCGGDNDGGGSTGGPRVVTSREDTHQANLIRVITCQTPDEFTAAASQIDNRDSGREPSPGAPVADLRDSGQPDRGQADHDRSIPKNSPQP